MVETAMSLPSRRYLFATEQAMVKIVPGEEFITANRMVASTKLAEGDFLAFITPLCEEKELVLQTRDSYFLRFSLEEIPVLKKNSRGVRGMKLEKDDKLEQVWFPEREASIQYKGKEVHLNRLKISKRDGKGTKTRI